MNRDNIESTKAFLRGMIAQNYSQNKHLLPEDDKELCKFFDTINGEFMLAPHELGTSLIELIPEVAKCYPKTVALHYKLSSYMHIFGQQASWAINICRYKEIVYDDIQKVMREYVNEEGGDGGPPLQLLQSVCEALQTATRVLRPILRHYVKITNGMLQQMTEGEDWKNEDEE